MESVPLWRRPSMISFTRNDGVMMDNLPEGATAAHDLWPGGPPADFINDRSEAIFAHPGGVPERWIRNVTRPTLTQFPATGPRRGITALVVPGGAFHFVSIDNEGYDVARALNAAGIDAFVLKYRGFPMPEADADIPAFMQVLDGRLDHPVPGQTAPPGGSAEVDVGRALASQDGQQAMRRIRAQAVQWGVDATRLGVIGFSAGGGVAVDLALAAPPDCRPAWAAPIYPAWAPAAVPPDAPSLFLATAADDPLVAPFSTARLGELAHRAGVPVALHMYGNGGHGFGIRRQGHLSDRWFQDFLDWLATR
jgi:acetyl esterase/lipase